MTIENLCDLFDSHMIVDKMNKMENTFTASSELIYSDGEFDHNIDSEGYIKISNIRDAMYIIFIDSAGDIFLCVYKYIPETKYKNVIDKLNKVREITGMKRHNNIGEAANDRIRINNSLVDINNLQCPECKEIMSVKEKSGKELMIAECSNCGTKLLLEPSKYYVITTKQQKYDKTDNFIDLEKLEG